MNVERAPGRGFERPLGQKQPVSRDHENCGARRRDARLHGRIAQRGGLKYLEPARNGELLDRALSWAQAAPRRPVGLGEYQRYFVTRLEQRGERALCECRGACKDEAQESARRP